MTVESILTRELDIRFIDAKAITNEARVNLGIQGYPTSDQNQEIRAEAIRIFRSRPEASKNTMRRLSDRLEEVKLPVADAGSSALFSDAESCDSLAFSEISSATKRSRKSFMFNLGRP